jgi:hypothetical protein
MPSSNAFATAMSTAANTTTGDNGALMVKDSGNPFVTYFTNIVQSSEREFVTKAVNEMVAYIESRGDTTFDILTIFRFYCFKRGCRNDGEGYRDASHYFLLALYDHYPEIVCQIARDGLQGHYYGYWKDIRRIIQIIHATPDMSRSDIYRKYDPLVKAMREAMITQRTEDVKIFSVWVKRYMGKSLNTLTTEEIIDGVTTAEVSPDISLLGRWITREKGADNKGAHWYIGDYSHPLVCTHANYIIRGLLVRKNADGSTTPFPDMEKVPYSALGRYRKVNSKLSAATKTLAQLMAGNHWDKADPNFIPSIAKFRHIKALFNEKLKVSPTASEYTTGNRHPNHEGRVKCRQAMIDFSTDPSKIKIKGLSPHEVVHKAHVSSSTAISAEMEATYTAMVDNYRVRMEEVIAKASEELAANPHISVADQELIKSIRGGNFLGCADISGSMTWGGYNNSTAPNRPLDIAVGLTAFISSIASPHYRDFAMSFSGNPKIYNLKHSDGTSFNARERHNAINDSSILGYNTDIGRMYDALITHCVNGKVPDDQLPVVVIFSDMNFDSQCQTTASRYQTIHKNTLDKWIRAGYTRVPTIVYWNLNEAPRTGTQTSADYPGVMFLQGSSPRLFDLIIYGEMAPDTEEEVVVDGVVTKVKVSSVTPETTFYKAMDNVDFYHPVHESLFRAGAISDTDFHELTSMLSEH